MDDPVVKPSIKAAKSHSPQKGGMASRAPIAKPDAKPSLTAKAAALAKASTPAVPPVLAAPAPAAPAPAPVAAPPEPQIPVDEDAPLALAVALAAPAADRSDVVDVASPVAEATTPVAPRPVAPVITAPAHTTNAVKDKLMETIENVTHTTQNAFNDASDRAKGAVEKSQKMFEEANEFGKGNLEALVESSKIVARGFEALSQDAAAFAKKSFEEATTAAKTMSSVKSPTELLKLQSDYVRSAFDAMVQQTSHNTETMLKLVGEIMQPLSNRAALGAEKMKAVA